MLANSAEAPSAKKTNKIAAFMFAERGFCPTHKSTRRTSRIRPIRHIAGLKTRDLISIKRERHATGIVGTPTGHAVCPLFEGALSMRAWIERAVAILLLLAAGAGLWFGYKIHSRPVELKVAAGPADSDDHALLTGLSRRLTSTNAALRLRLVAANGPLEAARALDRGEVDLAVIRADLPVPSSARAVAILQKHGVIVVATDKAKKAVENFGNLKGRRLGIVGTPGVNDRLIDRLASHSGLAPTAITRVPLARADVVDAIRKGRVDAVLATGPLNGATVAAFNAAVARAFRGVPAFVEIDAEAIAKTAPEYTSEEIPAGAFRSSPAIPEEGITMLFVDHLLVAKASVDEDRIAALTRLIFDSRVPLQAEYPTARLMQAASTEKDAAVPVHKGAAAYYGDTEKTLFERYGDALFYGPMLLSLLGTAGLAAYRYLSRDTSYELADRLTRLRKITRVAAGARSLEEVTALEDELTGMFDELVEKLAHGGLSESEISTALFVFKHVSDALAERRRALGARKTIATAMPDPDPAPPLAAQPS
jgi:TRAP-type uncharacterized transport system substrate-binding protein